MVSALTLVYGIALPAAGAAAAWVAGISSWRRASGAGAVPETPQPPAGPIEPAGVLGPPWGPPPSTPLSRFLVFMVLPATVIVFGILLFMVFPRAEVRLGEAGIELSARTYGVAALLAGVGQAIVLRRGVAAAVVRQREFGRVVVLCELAEAVAILGLVIAWAMLGRFDVSSGGSPTPGLEAMALAALLMNVASLGAPVAAVLAMGAYDPESSGSWPRSLGRGAVGLAFALLVFAWAFATLIA